MSILNKLIIGNITFAKIADEWLSFKKQSIKESTFYRYKYVVQNYLNELNDLNISKLLKYNFNLYIDKLTESLSIRTVEEIVTILKSILKFTGRKYDVDFKLDLIAPIKREKKQIEILTRAEVRKLEEACNQNEELRSKGILVCLYTGMRIGELCALKWEDIDLNKRRISINRTMQRIYRKGDKSFVNIDRPKSQKSIRTIPISSKLLKMLKGMKKKCASMKKQYVMTEDENRFIEPRNMQRYFENYLKKIKMPYHNFHILRHTFATECIKAGMDIKSLSEILGHSSVSITLNRYVHPTFESKIKYIDKI